MVTTLYLIRHGETVGSEVQRYKGSIDVPLSEKGVSQMEDAALFVERYLASSSYPKYPAFIRGAAGPGSERLSAVYTSDLSRAVRSAEIVARRHGVEPIVVRALRERHFGVWEGMSFEEIRTAYPEEFAAWASDPLKFSPPQGESTEDVRERVIPAVERIVADHTGQRIAVVAHGGVNRVILCHVLGMPLENIFRVEQDHAAVSVIEYWERYPVVRLINGGKQ
jgi:alpha-ribazole phosphatase